jgi:hypothetical protein
MSRPFNNSFGYPPDLAEFREAVERFRRRGEELPFTVIEEEEEVEET